MELQKQESLQRPENQELIEAAGALGASHSVTVGNTLPPMPKPKIDKVERNIGVNPVYGDNLPLGPSVQTGPLHDTYFA